MMKSLRVIVFGGLGFLVVLGLVSTVLFRPVMADNLAMGDLNGNVLYMNPGDRVYLQCEACEGMTFNEEFDYVQAMRPVGAVLGGTATPHPVETGQPVPTETALPTLTPTDVPNTQTPTVEPLIQGCVDQSRVGDFENYLAIQGDMVTGQDPSIEHLGLDEYIKATANHPNTTPVVPYDPESYVEWCFYPEFVGTYQIEVAVYGATNKDDSFWLRVNEGTAYLFEWQERLPVKVKRVNARGQSAPIEIEVNELDVPVFIRLHPREDGARLYSIHLAQIGMPTATPAPATPIPTVVGEYPPPPPPTVDPYPGQ